MTDRHEDEIMTVAEVAAYLHLAEKTVVRMAQRGEIPAAKVASQWRFMRPILRDWLATQMHLSPPGPASAPGNRPLLPLRDVVRPDLVNLDLTPGPKEDVLGQLVGVLAETGFASDPPRLLAGLIERERMMSTGMGYGIALPHPRRPIPGMFASPAVVVGLCRPGTGFDAVDGRPVDILFLPCATRDDVHLQLMAGIAWLTRQTGVMDALRKADSPEEAVDLIRDAA